jgi:hypothetical protein
VRVCALLCRCSSLCPLMLPPHAVFLGVPSVPTVTGAAAAEAPQVEAWLPDLRLEVSTAV